MGVFALLWEIKFGLSLTNTTNLSGTMRREEFTCDYVHCKTCTFTMKQLDE